MWTHKYMMNLHPCGYVVWCKQMRNEQNLHFLTVKGISSKSRDSVMHTNRTHIHPISYQYMQTIFETVNNQHKNTHTNTPYIYIHIYIFVFICTLQRYIHTSCYKSGHCDATVRSKSSWYHATNRLRPSSRDV